MMLISLPFKQLHHNVSPQVSYLEFVNVLRCLLVYSCLSLNMRTWGGIISLNILSDPFSLSPFGTPLIHMLGHLIVSHLSFRFYITG